MNVFQCYKKFGRKDHLKQHNRTHTRQQSLQQEDTSSNTNKPEILNSSVHDRDMSSHSSIHDQSNEADNSTSIEIVMTENNSNVVEKEI